MSLPSRIFRDPEDFDLKVYDRDGEPWFVLTEVCKKLQIGNPSQAAARLDADEKGIISNDTLGGSQRVIVINESGFYSVVLSSRKPEARAFRKWVTGEVLPSIRKTGGYGQTVPAFIRRASANWDRVDDGYFSVISELSVIVWGRLEREGHVMADHAPDGKQNRPDVAVGMRFSKWLSENFPDICSDYKTYQHSTDEWTGEARQYPISTLPVFRTYVEKVWWPLHGIDYIRTRDPVAIPFFESISLRLSHKE